MKWWLRKQFLRLKLYAAENYETEAESLIIWYAVCFAFGVAFYFTYPFELPVWVVVTVLECVLLLLWLNRRKNGYFKFLTYVSVFVLGLCIAKADAQYRANHVENTLPEISYLYGRVKDKDYNSNNHTRLLLTDVENYDHALKGDFRISLMKDEADIKPGMCVELLAKFPQELSPNPLSSYNFERTLFYKGISGVGYSIASVYEKPCAEKNGLLTQFLIVVREKIKTLTTTVPQKEGAIIQALTIGDKSGINENQAENYRTAGLAHFLAISGMHMGMIALLIFFLIRVLLLPFGNGRYDFRKPAAVVAMVLTFLYFLISGQSVSCIRAFIMTSMVLLGILLNRRAISLRLWAFAVLVVTIITPESVVSPGFLMSFAAVLGLVSFYESNTIYLRRIFYSENYWGRFAAYVVGLLLTDLVASLMTLPYSLYYFQRLSVYTTLGNLLAGPVIVFWVMPALLLFLISLPLGLGHLSIKLLAKGIEVINNIVAQVSSLSGAAIGENMGIVPDWSIFILTLGLLWLCIWQARWRLWGLVLIVIGILGVLTAPRPDFVFDEYGKTYAYRDAIGKLTPSCFADNRFLMKMWTGQKGQKECENSKDGIIKCSDNSCVYKERIKFSDNHIELDGKEVPLGKGGYINLNRGIYYTTQHGRRIWQKI